MAAGLALNGIDAAKQLRSLAQAFFVSVAIPNAILFCVALSLGIERPLVNIDYFVATFLFVFGYGLLGGFVGLSLFVVDGLCLFGQILPIIRISDIFYLFGFLFSASPSLIILLVGFFLIAVFSLWLMSSYGKRLDRLCVLLVFNFLVVIYAVDVNTSSDNRVRFYRASEDVLVSSQTVSFFEARSATFLQNFDLEGASLVTYSNQSATDPWFSELKNEALPARMLLVVNESWGVALNPAVSARVLAPITSLPLEFFKEGSLPFSGVTIEGELRELCKRKPLNYNLSKTIGGYDNCLPKALKAKGYATASIHGAVSRMYDRTYWYPRAGFDQSFFFESHAWPRRCHSFPGACDLDMGKDIEGFFQSEGDRFMYWLTLNSHYAYDQRDISLEAFDCAQFSIPVGTESCRNIKLQAQYFTGLSEILKSESMHGVEVIVVGDHQPVISDLNERPLYFVEKRVPWIHFKLK